MPAGVIDQDPAHNIRRDAEKMGAVLPLDVFLIDELQVSFMNKRGRLQRMVGALAA